MTQPAIWLGTSLKMYFSYQQTIDWCRAVAETARHHPAVRDGHVGLFVLPSFPVIPAMADIFNDTPVRFGAQNIAPGANGAWTGEVSASMVQELKGSLAEIGHAERRRHFAESETQIASKVALALEHNLTPVLCIGEEQQGTPQQAVALCAAQLASALQDARRQRRHGNVFFAYEPQWAIGAAQPAPDSYIREVCSALRQLTVPEGITLSVIYGGSAGPGLITRLHGSVDGLFLGRFAHDPGALAQMIDEAALLTKRGK